MAMIEDLDVFFDTDEFAVTAIFDDGETMPVIFDRAHIEAMGGAGGIDGTQPIALARSYEVAAHHVAAGTHIRIPQSGQAAWGSQEWFGGTRFTVRSLEPDGTGLTVLVLEAP